MSGCLVDIPDILRTNPNNGVQGFWLDSNFPSLLCLCVKSCTIFNFSLFCLKELPHPEWFVKMCVCVKIQSQKIYSTDTNTTKGQYFALRNLFLKGQLLKGEHVL